MSYFCCIQFRLNDCGFIIIFSSSSQFILIIRKLETKEKPNRFSDERTLMIGICDEHPIYTVHTHYTHGNDQQENLFFFFLHSARAHTERSLFYVYIRCSLSWSLVYLHFASISEHIFLHVRPEGNCCCKYRKLNVSSSRRNIFFFRDFFFVCVFVCCSLRVFHFLLILLLRFRGHWAVNTEHIAIMYFIPRFDNSFCYIAAFLFRRSTKVDR